jgi:hypothetical protein
MPSRAPPITAIVLLLLPVLYVGSYLALVLPGPPSFSFSVSMTVSWDSDPISPFDPDPTYRLDSDWLPRFFWPLEQLDRRLRPQAWEDAFWSREGSFRVPVRPV